MSQMGIQIHKRSNTKMSGNGRKNIKFRDKRRSEVGNYFSATKFADSNVNLSVRRRGGASGVSLVILSIDSLTAAHDRRKLDSKRQLPNLSS